jgi:hypothetical protein
MAIIDAFRESVAAHPLYTWTVFGVVVMGIAAFITLLFISAPYGRHFREGWGPTMNATALWIVMEAPSPISFAVVYFMSTHAFETVPLILLAMFMTHYVYRSFIYPFRMRGGHKQKPILMAVLAIVFNIANGSTNAFAITELSPHLLDSAWLVDPRFVVGFVLFVTGYAINHQSDAILRNLRKPGESGYKIPHGGLFRWVSSPNYLGELIEWTGFALAAWTVPSFVFLFFTASNLVPRALSNHRWYLENFDDYPERRRAVIPFLL